MCRGVLLSDYKGNYPDVLLLSDLLCVGDHWSTWVADVDACPVEFEPRCYNAVPQQSTVAGLVTGLQMVTLSLWKPFMSPSTGLSGEHKRYFNDLFAQ